MTARRTVPWLIGLVGLAAVRADGDTVQVSAHVASVLTVLDGPPPKAALAEAFTSAETLRELALGTSVDQIIRLRAIGALPSLCTDPCAAGSVAHDTLIELATAPATAPLEVQRARAAIEALASLGPISRDDVIAIAALLDHDSRDLRTTVVRALLTISDCTAKQPLLRRLGHESVKQVQVALSAALSALSQCH